MAKQYTLNGQTFVAGNVVRVMRQAETGEANGMGEGVKWENSYHEAMDRYLGMTFVIADIGAEGVEFETEHEGYSFLFPLSSLDWIAAAKVEKVAA